MSIQEGVKPYDQMTVLEKLQNAVKSGGYLAPGGTLPVVRLHTAHMFVDYEFVKGCVNELEVLTVRIALGDLPNNLEKLAYMLLCDSAYIDLSKEK